MGFFVLFCFLLCFFFSLVVLFCCGVVFAFLLSCRLKGVSIILDAGVGNGVLALFERGVFFDSGIFSLCLDKKLGMLLESFVVAGLWK